MSKMDQALDAYWREIRGKHAKVRRNTVGIKVKTWKVSLKTNTAEGLKAYRVFILDRLPRNANYRKLLREACREYDAWVASEKSKDKGGRTKRLRPMTVDGRRAA